MGMMVINNGVSSMWVRVLKVPRYLGEIGDVSTGVAEVAKAVGVAKKEEVLRCKKRS